MTLGERIKTRRDAKRLSQDALGQLVGVTRNAVSLWEAGKSKPTDEHLRELAVIFGVDVEWLKSGRDNPTAYIKGLPLRGTVAAGVWREVVESQDPDMKTVPVAPDPRYPQEAQYALLVEGNSLNKVAVEGSMLHCVDLASTGLDIRNNDLVIVQRNRAGLIETTAKRVRKGSNGLQLWPESTDPAHQKPLEVSVNGAEIQIKALVLYIVTPVGREA